MTLDLADKAHGATEQIRASDWPERISRVGLAARGVMYGVVAFIALRVATGRGADEIDKQGALRGISHQPFGKLLLALLALGFLAHVAWRWMKAAIGAGEGSDQSDRRKDIAKRVLDVGRGLVYAVLFFNTVKVLLTNESGKGGDENAKSWSARLMMNGAGRALVILVGLGLLVAGLVLVVRACKQKFEKHLRMQDLSSWQRTWLPRLGTVGYAARGVVAALVGAFVLQSGVSFDPEKAVGVDGALKNLAGRPFGPALLALTAFGLLAFGCFSFVEARYRKVLEE